MQGRARSQCGDRGRRDTGAFCALRGRHRASARGQRKNTPSSCFSFFVTAAFSSAFTAAPAASSAGFPAFPDSTFTSKTISAEQSFARVRQTGVVGVAAAVRPIGRLADKHCAPSSVTVSLDASGMVTDPLTVPAGPCAQVGRGSGAADQETGRCKAAAAAAEGSSILSAMRAVIAPLPSS